jgi:hypothetical protein
MIGMKVLLIYFVADLPLSVETILALLLDAGLPLRVTSEDWYEMRRMSAIAINDKVVAAAKRSFLPVVLPDIDRAEKKCGLTKGIEFDTAHGTTLTGTLARAGILLAAGDKIVPDDDDAIGELVSKVKSLGLVSKVNSMS